jgi:Tfp pilus assembly protein PilF
MAAQADEGAKGPAEAWLAFAQRVGRVEDMDAAFRELLKRDKENPEPIVRYGDFLLNQRKDAPGAVTQYRQALIWRADDDATRAKIAEIYIALGVESFGKQQYAVAQTHFLEAQKYITDKTSEQARKIQEHLRRLAAMRGR